MGATMVCFCHCIIWVCLFFYFKSFYMFQMLESARKVMEGTAEIIGNLDGFYLFIVTTFRISKSGDDMVLLEKYHNSQCMYGLPKIRFIYKVEKEEVKI